MNHSVRDSTILSMRAANSHLDVLREEPESTTHASSQTTARTWTCDLQHLLSVARDTPGLTTTGRHFDGVVVLDVTGRMTVETGAHGLPDYVRRCIEQRQRGVALNLRDVPDCDTGGVASLLRCLTLVDASGGRLVLVNVQPRVLDLLKQMGLLPEFRTFTDEVAALMQLQRTFN
jgi:anti-anti-sigma factor